MWVHGYSMYRLITPRREVVGGGGAVNTVGVLPLIEISFCLPAFSAVPFSSFPLSLSPDSALLREAESAGLNDCTELPA